MAKSKELDIVGNITPGEAPHVVKTSKEASKELLEKYMNEETRLVEGRFKIIGMPDGTPQTIIFRKYPGIPEFNKSMISGGIYKIPLYVARHLQGFDVTARAVGGQIHSCQCVKHRYKVSKDDMPKENMDNVLTEPNKYDKRYSFESLEFEKAL